MPSRRPPRRISRRLLKVEPLAIEMGLGLVKFVGGGQESPLIKRIARHSPAARHRTGFRARSGARGGQRGAQGARIRDLAQGRRNRPLRTARGLRTGHPGGQGRSLRRAARQTKEPAFGMTGWWVPAEQAEAARRAGFTVVDAVSVLGTHLAELVRRYAQELFSRQDAKKFLDRVAAGTAQGGGRAGPQASAALHGAARAAEPAARARFHPRCGHDLEALSEAAVTTRNPVLLTEYVRQALRRIVVKPYLKPGRRSAGVPAGPATGADRWNPPCSTGNRTAMLTLAPPAIRDLLQRIAAKGRQPGNAGGGHRQLGLALFPAADGRAQRSATCSSSRITKSPWKSKSFR